MFPFLRKFSLAGQINGSLVSDAIAQVETSTSAEIRVHFTTCPSKLTLLDEATAIFHQLHMHKTENRNGVLIFLRLKSREIAVIGDEGIHNKVGTEFWEAVKQEIIDTIKQFDLNEGIVRGVRVVGKQLAKHFPPSADNPNELSNEVTSSRGFFN